MKKVSLSWLSYYEHQLGRLETLLPQLRESNYLSNSPEKKTKLIAKYLKKIDEYKFKILKEKMKQK